MPPWRTTLEIRGASMPDSRATMVSASSDEARCCTSKSAGTYSASITGVIGSTLSSRTEPLQVCDSVAAVAIAGFARSVSARSIGTRMDLNIFTPPLPAQRSMKSTAGGRLQQFRADEQLDPAAPERDVVPIVGVEVDSRKARGRQVVGERAARLGAAAAGERERQFVQ